MPATDDVEKAVADDEGDDAAPLVGEKYIGTIVANGYRIKRHIGSGGSSHVFEAEHLRLGKAFAIKLLRPEMNLGRKTAQRFRREAKAIALLQSEHIVSVIDCGELNDCTPYLVMELLQGEDLRTLLRREHILPVRRAVQIVIEACRGLGEVHAAGLVHRDLKPENLFITRRITGEDWCKVLDFGVVKMENSQCTAQGAIVGTVRYMAPEQLADVAAVAPATDVYALGAVLYECLCGKPLHAGDSVQEVMYQVMNVQPAALAGLRPELPQALTAVIEGAIAKRKDERPQRAAELAELLSRALRPSSEPSGRFDTPVEDGELLPKASTPSMRRTSASRTVMTTVATALMGVAVGVGVAPAGSRTAASPSASRDRTESTGLAAAGSTAPLPALASSSPAAEPQPSLVHASTSSAAVPQPSPSSAARNPARRAAVTPTLREKPLGKFDDVNPYGTE